MSYDEDTFNTSFSMDEDFDDDSSFEDEEMEGMHFTDEEPEEDPDDKFH